PFGQLDVLVTALQRTRGDALHVLDIALILDQRRVGLDALALGAPQELRHRDAFEFAANVPQPNVEAAHGVHDDAGAAEAMQHALDPRHELRIGGILADGDAADQRLDGSDGRGAAEAIALAPTDHTL